MMASSAGGNEDGVSVRDMRRESGGFDRGLELRTNRVYTCSQGSIHVRRPEQDKLPGAMASRLTDTDSSDGRDNEHRGRGTEDLH